MICWNKVYVQFRYIFDWKSAVIDHINANRKSSEDDM